MDQQAKQAFRSGCLACLLLLVGLLAGCWLLMIEFGAAFHETPQDRVGRTIAWIVIFVLLAAFVATCLKSKRQGRRTHQSDPSRDSSAVPPNAKPEDSGGKGEQRN